MQPLFDKAVICGIGLIGSSLARVLKRDGLAAQVVTLDASAEHRQQALTLGIVDAATADIAEAVAGADLIVLSTPVGAYADLAAAMAPHLKTGAIVTDVGSVKVATVRDVGPLIPEGVHFVPGHPIAGTEYSGPAAGFAELFEGRWTILTPPPGTDEAAVAKITQVWQAAGSMVEVMEPGHHDRVLAIVSHLPHLIAFTICGTADNLAEETRQEVVNFSASGFRDFTRIAASDPVMWRDVFLNNREALLEMLQRFMEDAQAMARAVRWGDATYIEDMVERGRKIRRSLIEQKQA